MRDIISHPITADEVINTLERLRDEQSNRLSEGLVPPGDITCLVLGDAIERIHRLRDLEQ